MNFSFLSYLILFLLTVLVEILGTIGGFGSSIFFVSIAQFFFDFQTVLALTGLLHVFSNSSKLFLFWQHIDWKLVAWLGISSVVLAIAGAFLTTVIRFEYARTVLGIFMILFSILFLAKPGIRIAPTLFNSVSRRSPGRLSRRLRRHRRRHPGPGDGIVQS
ncbi:MAG: sulfite exporter TauE/SafE family protein [Bacteroidota bacterium]